MKLTCTINKDQSVSLEILNEKTLVSGKEINYQLLQKKKDEYQLLTNNKSYEIKILSIERQFVWMLIDDFEVRVDTKNELDLMMSKLGIATNSVDGNLEVLAPMPGTILEIMVSPGQRIKKGDALLVLNAMKMENVIKATRGAEINEVQVSRDQNVIKNQVLITFIA